MKKTLLLLSMLTMSVLAAESSTVLNRYYDEINQVVIRWRKTHRNTKVSPADDAREQLLAHARKEGKPANIIAAYKKSMHKMSGDIYFLPPSRAPRLYETLGRMADHFKVAMPLAFLLNSAYPNLATTTYHPDAGVVFVYGGALTNKEWTTQVFDGVLAHEFGHIVNADSRWGNRLHKGFLYGRPAASLGMLAWALRSIHKVPAEQRKWVVMRALGKAGLVHGGTWLAEVLMRMMQARRAEDRADAVGGTFRPRRTVAAAEVLASDSGNVRYHGHKHVWGSLRNRLHNAYRALIPHSGDTIRERLIGEYAHALPRQRLERARKQLS